jgi:flagellar biosynthesis protein FliR
LRGQRPWHSISSFEHSNFVLDSSFDFRHSNFQAMPIDLTPFLPHLPVWALVLFRLSGIFFFAPILGSAIIPARVKVFLALGLSFCVYPMLLTPGSASSVMMQQALSSGVSLWGLVGAVLSELMIGAALGFGANLPLVGMQLAGQVADQQMGLGIGGVFNPDMQEESGALGQFYFLMAMVLFLIAGGHRVLLTTLVGSFGHIPLGGLLSMKGGGADGAMLALMLGLLSSAFELALRVSAPLLCLVFLETIAMGFLARTVPQMNVMSVGFALRILIGSAVLIGAVQIKANVFAEFMRTNLRQLQHFFGGA